jgi:hypothetical protein
MERATDHLSQNVLAGLPHGEVLVLPGPPGDSDALTAAWKAARDDALYAYEAWREDATPEAFVVYQAAADREEAAAAVLAGRSADRRPRWYRLRTDGRDDDE